MEFYGSLAIKDPALSLLWLKSLQWCRFNPWPRNFCMTQKKKKKKKKIRNIWPQEYRNNLQQKQNIIEAYSMEHQILELLDQPLK